LGEEARMMLSRETVDKPRHTKIHSVTRFQTLDPDMAEAVAEFSQEGILVIRPSSTNTWFDCEARTAARSYPALMISKGYELRRLPKHVGAVVGTGTHAGAEFMQRKRLNDAELGKTSEAVDYAVAKMEEEIAEHDVCWDDATPRFNEAQIQVQRMVHVYRRDVAEQIRVVAIEERLEAMVSANLMVSGKADVITILPGMLRDTKTGKRRSYCLPQLGSYSSLARAHGHQVEKVGVDYVPRVSVKKEQPPVESLESPRELAESVAKRTITRMDATMREFQQTGDLRVFSRNPSSSLCSERFCPWYQTSACPESKAK
jgi:hypothetical protein